MVFKKVFLSLLLASFLTTGFKSDNRDSSKQNMSAASPLKVSGYDENLVEIVNVKDQYSAVIMSRKGERIKAKYFASQYANKSVNQRYKEWAVGRKVIMLSSGTYMNQYRQPVGITVDNGNIVNNVVEDFSGVVIIYATGGVVASDLKLKDLSMKCNGKSKIFDLTDNIELEDFLECSKTSMATVFQTHLLIYKNQLRVYDGGSQIARERRFLAVCQDPKTKEVKHVLINTPVKAAASLLEATKTVKNMLDLYGTGDIIFMVNLDTGAGDVFTLYNPDGTVNNKIAGTLDLINASNLLVYYYE